MHFLTLVIIPPDGDPEALVAERMAPFQENWTEETETSGFWDWYQIGGRYTGSLDGYAPQADPQNTGTCQICGGSGRRTDMVVRDGCNGCAGKGRALKWPTAWARHYGDVGPARPGIESYGLIDRHGAHADRNSRPDFETWAEAALHEAQVIGWRVAVVDCHC